MSLLLRTNYAIARSSLKRQKLRTFLTSLGIAIVIASIVYTFGIIGSFKNLVKSETNDALLVLQQKPEESTDISSILTAKPLTSSPFSKETVELIQKSINTTAAVSPLTPITCNLSGDNLVANGNIIGVNESALKILGQNQNRFFPKRRQSQNHRARPQSFPSTFWHCRKYWQNRQYQG